MSLSKEQILDILESKITRESEFIIMALYDSDSETLNKDALWNSANRLYDTYKQNNSIASKDKLIPSRFVLNHHTSMLEGAGIVELQSYGRTRVYKLSKLGMEIIEYRTEKNKSAKGDN